MAWTRKTLTFISEDGGSVYIRSTYTRLLNYTSIFEF